MNDTHPEPAEIAALDAELLEPEEATLLRDHLAGCPSCAEIHADLEALRRELADIPSPPTPTDVRARIDAALDAEAAVSVSRETPRAPVRRWPRLALAAAAALGVLGLGGSLLEDVRDTADSAADTVYEESVEAGGEGSSADSLEDQVRELLTGNEQDLDSLDSDPTLASGTATESTPTEDDAASTLPRCVQNAADRTDEPLAAREQRYQGQWTFLVVYMHRGDPGLVDAYVVADCTGAGTGEILAEDSYPRP